MGLNTFSRYMYAKFSFILGSRSQEWLYTEGKKA